MGILQRIKYELSTWKKLVKIDVGFELITQSGNCIHIVDKNILPLKEKIVHYTSWDYYKYQLEISKQHKSLFNDIAENILRDYQKKETKKMNSGLIDGGDYIVKCVWNTDLIFEDISYTEYLEYIKTKTKVYKT